MSRVRSGSSPQAAYQRLQGTSRSLDPLRIRGARQEFSGLVRADLGSCVIGADFRTPGPIFQQVSRNLEDIGVCRSQSLELNPGEAHEYLVRQILGLARIVHATQEISDQRRPETAAEVLEVSLPCRVHSSPDLRGAPVDHRRTRGHVP